MPNDDALRTWLLHAAHDSRLGRSSRRRSQRAQWLQGARVVGRHGPDARRVRAWLRVVPAQQARPARSPGHAAVGGCAGRAWEAVCLDFIGPLPVTASGHDTIMVVIEQALALHASTFRCARRPRDRRCSQLLHAHVLAHHGAPRAIVSDRDSRFTSHFWEDLWAEPWAQTQAQHGIPPADGRPDGAAEPHAHRGAARLRRRAPRQLGHAAAGACSWRTTPRVRLHGRDAVRDACTGARCAPSSTPS